MSLAPCQSGSTRPVTMTHCFVSWTRRTVSHYSLYDSESSKMFKNC